MGLYDPEQVTTYFVVLWSEEYIRQVLPTWIITLLYGPILRQLDFAMPKQSSLFYVRIDGHMVVIRPRDGK